MTINKKLGYCGYGTGSFKPFDKVFDEGVHLRGTIKEAIEGVDAIVIWGGEDISTGLYGEDGGVWTGANRHMSARDQVETALCHEAIKQGKPIIGVCRGAQLLCALAGGKLIQDVNHHAGPDHEMETEDGRTIIVNSYHHQMMWPYNGPEHKLIAWSKQPLSKGHYAFSAENVKQEISKPEPEVVYFPKIKGLALQYHPEFASPNDEFVQYSLDLVKEYILT